MPNVKLFCPFSRKKNKRKGRFMREKAEETEVF